MYCSGGLNQMRRDVSTNSRIPLFKYLSLLMKVWTSLVLFAFRLFGNISIVHGCCSYVMVLVLNAYWMLHLFDQNLNRHTNWKRCPLNCVMPLIMWSIRSMNKAKNLSVSCIVCFDLHKSSTPKIQSVVLQMYLISII